VLAMRVAREDPVAEVGVNGHALVLAKCVWYRLRLGGNTPVFTGCIVGQVEVQDETVRSLTVEPPAASCRSFVFILCNLRIFPTG
jgi:hypothetical protein